MAKKKGNDKVLVFFITLTIQLFVLFAKSIWWVLTKLFAMVVNSSGNRTIASSKNKRSITTNTTTNPSAMVFQNHVRIALESIYIIQTTLNWDILKSRIEVNEDSIIELQKFTSQTNAMLYFSEVVDSYKLNYYDKPLTDKQIQITLEPSRKVRYSFYGDSIYDSFNKYLENQNIQIDSLKTEKAKENRKEKIKEIAIHFYNLMNVYGTDNPNYSSYYLEIKKYT